MATELEALQDRLRGYCAHIPPTHGTWSYQQTQAFKKAIQSAKKLLGKRGVTTGELSAKINELHGYW
jgi:hypothetical protein